MVPTDAMILLVVTVFVVIDIGWNVPVVRFEILAFTALTLVALMLSTLMLESV